MELRQLKYFLAVAETLNFRAAAEKLNMTQPPLSVSIRKLEEEIGAELLVRSTHQVELTAAGREILQDVRELLFGAEEVKRKAVETVAGLSGELRLGFVGSAKNRVLPRLLPEFRNRFPNVVLRVFEGSNAELSTAVLDRRLDLALLRPPLGERSELRTQNIEDDELVVALPARHRLAGMAEIRAIDLGREPYIGYTSVGSPGLAAQCRVALEAAGINPPIAQRAIQVETALFLVETGLGFALVPSSFRHRLNPGVVLLQVKDRTQWPKLRLAVAYDPALTSNIAKTMIDMCTGLVE
ncbi:LysR substrate-binding domain-containing protein [Brevibacterium sp. CSND-B09]|uniref:LysR substrate-binding domain-containing protein n=1 Tax=Brevibacterium sp. CSND-B09 TaxID=3462571 RepID=UPI00406A1F64